MNYTLSKKIFWLVPSLNLHQASVRLRCLHIALGLENNFGYENLIFSDIQELKKSIEPGSFLFIIKMPNEGMLSLLVKAKSLECKIIIDITDTVCDIHYKNNDYNFNAWILNSLIDLVNAIFVPTAKLRSHLLEHADSLNKQLWDKKIRILPDIAETRRDAINVCEYLVDKFRDKIAIDTLKQLSSQSDAKGMSQAKRVLWFGNSYSPTSNMGISSLIPLLPAIKRLQDRQHFVLAICTNVNTDLSTIKAFGIQYELIEWSLAEIFRQLSIAGVSLITTGDDKRCEGKSNNRVLSSLTNNCPAIVIKHPNNTEFNANIDTSLKSGVSKFLFSKNSESERIKALNVAKSILDRYTINEIVKLYNLSLQNINLEVLAAQDQYAGLENHEKSALIICDELSVGEIDKISSLLKKAIPSCRVSYIHFAPLSAKTINYYSSNQIIPYLLKIGQLEKSTNFLINNDCVVMADNLNTSLYNRLLEYVNSMNRFSTTHKDSISLVKQSALKSFLKKSYIFEKPTVFDDPFTIRPENIPGRNKSSDITSKDLDILFVCGIESKNWILDGIAKEIGSRSKKSWAIYYCDNRPSNLPKANNYLFMHQALLSKFVRLKLIDWSTSTNINCWYTHPRDEDDETIAEFLDIFGSINRVIFACSENYNLWLSRGLEPKHGCVVLGGFDSSLFVPHNRTLSDAIGICSSFYERKNPELLFEIVSKMTDKKFILLGKNWESYARYEALIGLGNLEYVTVKYENYPTYYKKFKVFLSTSRLEGGPIPLIEAMACNCFPVVSNTGFASDLIKHSFNGFLFETSSSAKEVSELIEKAYIMNDVDIASSVSNYSWDHFSSNVLDEIEK